MNRYNPEIHNRRSIRLQGYDYSKAGLYFITICCQGRMHRFGHIENGRMTLNAFGRVAHEEWGKLPERFPNVKLDVFQIMPNHMHGIIVLIPTSPVGATLAVAPHDPADTVGSTLAVDPNEEKVTGIGRATARVAPTKAIDMERTIQPVDPNMVNTDNGSPNNVGSTLAVAPNEERATGIERATARVAPTKAIDMERTIQPVDTNMVNTDNGSPNNVGSTLAVDPNEEKVTGIGRATARVAPTKAIDMERTIQPVDTNMVNTDNGSPNNVGSTLAVAPNEERATGIGRATARVAPTEVAPSEVTPSISKIVGAYKSLVSNGCLAMYKSKDETMGKLWQRNYYEHIIRNEQAYRTISDYIINNPVKWAEDRFYSSG